MITRTTWPDLPEAVRTAIRHHTGRIDEVTPVQAGLNSGLSTILHTGGEPVFIKGMPTDHPQAATQLREADINPYVTPVAPRLLWRITTAGWDILGFEHIDGRHADLSPGSPDLPKIAEALAQLHMITATDVPLRRFEDRWADHLDGTADRACLSGSRLLHTDLNPGNILITTDAARITDWAWPTRGSSWVDPACLALWLINAGHTPHQAEGWMRHLPACATLDEAALDTFTAANARLWTAIADNDTSPWKQAIATTAQYWRQDRTRRRNVTPRAGESVPSCPHGHSEAPAGTTNRG